MEHRHPREVIMLVEVAMLVTTVMVHQFTALGVHMELLHRLQDQHTARLAHLVLVSLFKVALYLKAP